MESEVTKKPFFLEKLKSFPVNGIPIFMEKDAVNQTIRFVAKILKFESYPDAKTNTSLVGTNGRGCERIVVVAAEPEEARGFESFLQHCFWVVLLIRIEIQIRWKRC